MEARSTYEAFRWQLHENFIYEQSVNLKSSPKAFWNHINSKRKSNGLPDTMIYNNKTAKSTEEKANLFAEFFEDVYKKHEEDNSLDSFISNRNDEHCHNIIITEDIVKAELSLMDLNKGSGFDGVPSIFLRECSEQLKGPLKIVFETALSKKYYPKAFKNGLLTPIYKSGLKRDMQNYRGVNTVPNIAKVFDKVIYEQLKLLLIPLIKTTQHGFLPIRNIETNLMELSTHIHRAFDKNSHLDVFYADIRKAFDHLDVLLLVRKFAKYPISNQLLLWFKSYLTDRVQYVRLGFTTSRQLIVSSGVGQGTVEGPLLFITFFNDSDPLIKEVISLNFADDKKLASIIDCTDDAIRLQKRN